MLYTSLLQGLFAASGDYPAGADRAHPKSAELFAAKDRQVRCLCLFLFGRASDTPYPRFKEGRNREDFLRRKYFLKNKDKRPDFGKY